MATSVEKSPVTREVHGRSDDYIATMAAVGLLIRIKGSRSTYVVPWDLLHQKGGELAARHIISERLAAPDAKPLKARKVSRGLLATEAGR